MSYSRDQLNEVHKQALKVFPFINGQKKGAALLDCSDYFLNYNWLVAKANSKTDGAQTIRKEAVAFFKTLDSKAFVVKPDHIADMHCLIRKDDKETVIQAMVFAPMYIASRLICYLELFGVSKDRQGQKLGRQATYQLSDYIDSLARAPGVSQVYGTYIVAPVSRISKPHEFYRKLGFVNGTPFGFECWSDRGADTMHLTVTDPTNEETELRLTDLISIKSVSKAGKKRQVKALSKKQARDAGSNVDHLEEEKGDHQSLAANFNEPAIKGNGSALNKKEQNSEDTMSDEDDASKSCITGFTSKTGASNKHCMIGKCNGRHIKGSNWARHVRDIHKGSLGNEQGRDYIKCAGIGCNACSKGNQGYRGKRLSYICGQCKTNKRFDHFPKDSNEVCKVCLGSKSHISRIIPQLNKGNLMQLPTSSLQDRVIQPSDSLSQAGSKRLHSQIDCDAGGDDGFKEPSPKREKFEGYIPSGVGDGDIPMEEPHKLDQSTHSFKEVQVVVAHTDQAVINQLEALEKSKLHKVVCAQKVQKLCTMFTQDLILKYIASGKHQNLIDSIISVLQRVSQLEDDAVVGLAVASMVLGNACWEGTIKMFSQMDSERREKVFAVFKIHLQKHFNDELAEWLLKYWRVTEQQQLEMLAPVKSSLSATEVLTLSLAVAVQDIPLFVEFSQEFIQTSASSADMILESIIARPKQRKITFDQLLELAELIQQESNAPVIESIKETLAAAHICEWVTLIKEKQIGLNLLDAASIQSFIDELISIYGEIKQLEKDLTQCDDPMYEMVVHETANKPNNRQFALAQYCVGKLYTCQRQLWVVPSGQGKSRISHSSGVIGLMSEMFTKVHMVFENQHLLDRDKADFQDILLMLGYDETRFEYHIDLDFVCLPGELVIIDEADCFMFKDPSAFKLFAAEACCLCFTATPDNQDPKGVEARVITTLQFQRFNYSQAGANVVKVSLEVDETVQCETLEEKAQFIKERATQGPVHVYCDPPLTEQLKIAGCNPLVVTAATDYKVLRQLDQRVNGSFRVVVAQDQSAMRGLDYRSEQVKMTQVIDKSFENQREAIQGFNRVGRFGDECTRVKFNGVKIIDDKMSLAYTAKLFRFYAEMQKSKEHLKLKPVVVKKAKPVAAATTAPLKTIKSNLGQKRTNALLFGQTQLKF